MKKLFASLMLFAATFVLGSSASAVVLQGSSYSVYLAGEQSDAASLPTTTFDDQPAFFLRNDLLLTLTESDTALGSGISRISLNLSADGDLFPVFDENAFLGVGTFGDVLDLEMPVALYDARITIRDLAGNVLVASNNLADFAVINRPWDGAFPSTATTVRIDEIGGLGAASITFDFYVSEDLNYVPEPGSIVLCGIGLLAAAAARRKHGAKA